MCAGNSGGHGAHPNIDDLNLVGPRAHQLTQSPGSDRCGILCLKVLKSITFGFSWKS